MAAYFRLQQSIQVKFIHHGRNGATHQVLAISLLRDLNVCFLIQHDLLNCSFSTFQHYNKMSNVRFEPSPSGNCEPESLMCLAGFWKFYNIFSCFCLIATYSRRMLYTNQLLTTQADKWMDLSHTLPSWDWPRLTM